MDPIYLKSGDVLRDAVIVQDEPRHAIILAPDAHDVTIENVHVRFTARVAPVEARFDRGCGIIGRGQMQDVLIRNVMCRGHLGCGIFLGGPGETSLRGIVISGCGFGHGLEGVPGSVQSAMIKDVHLYAKRAESIALESNVCCSPNDSGLALVRNGKWDDSGLLRDVLISGNLCAGHERHGIIGTYGWSIEGLTMRDNIVYDNGWCGLYLNSTHVFRGEMEQWNKVVHNKCFHNGIGGTDNSIEGSQAIRGGLVISGGRRVRIDENLFALNGSPRLDFTADHAAGIRARGIEVVIAENNTFVDNRGGDVYVWQHPNPTEGVIDKRQPARRSLWDRIIALFS